MRRLRALETRLYRLLRHPRADDAATQPPRPWDAHTLAAHTYCLLVSYRRDGTPVATPVWFGITGGRLYLRSAASDGKVKRVRREPGVLIAPCSFRGKPAGPAMHGRARVLEQPDEQAAAERALEGHYGVGRRLYKRVRDPALEAAYIEVAADPDWPASQ